MAGVRFWVLCTLVPFIIAGIPVWWKTTTVNQLALPYELKTGAFEKDTNRFSLDVHVLLATPANDVRSIHNSLTTHVNTLMKNKTEFRDFNITIHTTLLSSDVQQSALRHLEEDSDHDFDAYLEKIVAKQSFRERVSYSLFVACSPTTAEAEPAAPAAPSMVLGLHRSGWVVIPSCLELNHERRITNTGTPGTDPVDYIVKAVIALVGPNHYREFFAPDQQAEALVTKEHGMLGHHLVFTLLNAAPHESGLLFDWDFDQAYAAVLEGVVSDVRRVMDVQVRSRVQNFATLPIKPVWDDTAQAYVITQRALHQFVIPQDWAPPALTLGPDRAQRDILNFVTFIPRPSQRPLRVQQADGSLHQSFVVHGWGGIVILNPDGPPETDTHADVGTKSIPSPEAVRQASVTHSPPNISTYPLPSHVLSLLELRQPLSQFVTHLRVLLDIDLPPVAVTQGVRRVRVPAGAHASNPGLAEWECDAFARTQLLMKQRHTARSLRSLISLVDSLPNMAVEYPVYDAVVNSLAALHESVTDPHVYDTSSLGEALNHSARAFRLSEVAFFHPSILSFLYFPEEHKYAIYVPFFVPVLVPVVMTLISELRHLLQVRMDRREKMKESEKNTEIVAQSPSK